MNGADAGGIFEVKHEDAGELLETLDRVTHKARSARHGYWFALMLFGLVILGALPLYRDTVVPGTRASGSYIEVLPNLPPHRVVYYTEQSRSGAQSGATALFWLIAVPAAYITVAAFYAVRARRTGVQGHIWSYVAAGLILFALLLATAPGVGALLHAPYWLISWRDRAGDLFIRGLTPVLVISLAFFVLARLERSWALFCISMAFLPVALLANLYNISNAFYRFTPWNVPDWAANITFAGGFLVLVGLISGLVTWRRTA